MKYAIEIRRTNGKISDLKVINSKNKNQEYTIMTINDIIRQIERGDCRFLTWDKDHNYPECMDDTAVIYVVNDEDGKYLRTNNDSSASNNLENLPEF